MSRSTPAVAHPRTLLFLVALSAIPVAHAQEVTKTWQSPAAQGQTLLNEGQAQKAVENNFAPYLAAGPLSWQVTGMRISGETVTYDYRIKPAKLIVTDWIYKFNNQDYDTEQAMVDAIKSSRVSSPGCPATQVVPGTWEGVPGAGLGDGADGSNTGESAVYGTPYYLVNPRTGTCNVVQASVDVSRSRTVKCPNTALMAWKPEIGMCGMHPAQEQIGSMLMKYSSSPVANQCPAQTGKGGTLAKHGNPCDATTGNKSQPESDLDLGWIQFVRHFNSMTSAPAGGFGPNWTHSHNLFLAMGTDSSGFPPSNVFTVGLIESDGTHIAFSAVGTAYEAANGSGDRLQQQGGDWLLYRSDEVLTFGSNGRLQQRAFENGTSLSYQHDAQGRLLSITHSSGRSLLFHYEAPAGDDLISALSVSGQLVASYTYNSNGQVATVQYPGNTVRVYHYENASFPRYLTGITTEDARRYSWYNYDAKGRVTCS